MWTRTYLIISVAKDVICKNGHNPVAELEAMPEVVDVEPVLGGYGLVVLVEAPVRAIHLVNKIMEKEWVNKLHILKPDLKEFDNKHGGLLLGEVLKAQAGKCY